MFYCRQGGRDSKGTLGSHHRSGTRQRVKGSIGKWKGLSGEAKPMKKRKWEEAGQVYCVAVEKVKGKRLVPEADKVSST